MEVTKLDSWSDMKEAMEEMSWLNTCSRKPFGGGGDEEDEKGEVACISSHGSCFICLVILPILVLHLLLLLQLLLLLLLLPLPLRLTHLGYVHIV